MEKYQNILDILNFKKDFNTFGGMGQTWKLVNVRNFTSTEIAAVRSNTVAEGKYGKTIVIFLKGGGQTYIPLSEDSANIPLGSSIDLNTAKLCDYYREGDGHIRRIKVGEILDKSYFAPRIIALEEDNNRLKTLISELKSENSKQGDNYKTLRKEYDELEKKLKYIKGINFIILAIIAIAIGFFLF